MILMGLRVHHDDMKRGKGQISKKEKLLMGMKKVLKNLNL